MLAIMRGGAWECKRAIGPFQNNQFFNFSLGIEMLQKFIKEKCLPSYNLAQEEDNRIYSKEGKL